MRTHKDTVIYLPQDDDANERWRVVAASLRTAGITDIRPAPMPAQSFTSKYARPVLLSSAEI
jgi:hypothetical protein